MFLDFTFNLGQLFNSLLCRYRQTRLTNPSNEDVPESLFLTISTGTEKTLVKVQRKLAVAGTRIYSLRYSAVETGDAGESIESEESQQIRGRPIKVRKQAGDVVQLVRTLP
jgi:hypothetical protein